MAASFDEFIESLQDRWDYDGMWQETLTTVELPDGLSVTQRPVGSTDHGEPITGGMSYFVSLVASYYSWSIPPGYEVVFRVGERQHIKRSPN